MANRKIRPFGERKGRIETGQRPRAGHAGAKASQPTGQADGQTDALDDISGLREQNWRSDISYGMASITSTLTFNEKNLRGKVGFRLLRLTFWTEIANRADRPAFKTPKGDALLPLVASSARHICSIKLTLFVTLRFQLTTRPNLSTPPIP